MFGSEDALIKIDMSEFMERHNVSRLVGAPPGYVGFDEGGQLTEAVRRKSYAVVLLDEVEKAHPEVFNILLQILEDGHLSDAKGRRVDFRNCIIIMTSNLGAKQLQTNSTLGFRAVGDDRREAAPRRRYEIMKEKVAAELKNNFRPEFLNRIDATVVFRSLTVEEITQIVDLMLERVRDQLRAQQMQLEVTQAAKDHIIKLGYDVAYGARPLRRVIQNMVEDVLAEHLLLGKYEPGTTIVVDSDPEAGLDIHAAERETPGRGLSPRYAGPRLSGRWPRPEPLRLPVVRRVLPPLGGPVPRLRRLEHASSRRSSASPSRARPRARRRPALGGAVAPAAWRIAGDGDVPRLPIGIAELDRVLGGGLVAGSLVLLGGEPGIGKSTLLLQAAAGVAAAGRPASACSTRRARSRRPRSGCAPSGSGSSTGPAGDGIRIAAESDVGRIVELARDEPARPSLVVDSIQTATVDELDGPAGSVGQVRESAAPADGAGQGRGDRGRPRRPRDEGRLDRRAEDPRAPRRRRARRSTASGTAALRLLRATKNRFGSTEEVGVFEMGERGLREVADPARAFLAEHDGPAPGSVVAPTLEGSRPLLVEVQALVAPAGYGTPRRTASGVDPNRLALLVAVLGRRAGIGLGEPRRLREPRRRPDRRRARPRPAARARPRIVAPRPADRGRHRRDRRGRPARRAARGGRARSPAARGRPARLRAGRSSRAPRGGAAAPDVAGPRDRRGRHASATRSTRRCAVRSGPDAWQADPADARLTAAPRRARGRRAATPREGRREDP